MVDETRLWTVGGLSRGYQGMKVTISQEVTEARFDEIHGEIVFVSGLAE